MRSHLILLPLALVALAPGAARADSIVFSNPLLRAWNGVIVHTPGEPSSGFLVNEQDASVGPSAALSTDLGFATVDALVFPLSLHAASSVDAVGLDALGYDYAIAEATTRYEADFVVGGGVGLVDLLLEVSLAETLLTDEPGFASSGLESIRIFEDGSLLYALTGESGIEQVQLEYDVLYRLEVRLTAYSRASVGYQTSYDRDLDVAVSFVPEPHSAALLGVGIAILGALRRGRRPRGSA